MKMSAGVEWAVHCCVVLSRVAGPMPAARLAEFYGVSKTFLAKHLPGMAAAGLVKSVEGHKSRHKVWVLPILR